MLVETTGGAKYTAADSQRMLKDLNLTQQVPSPVGCLIFCADLSITCKAMLACGYVHCMTVILAKLSSLCSTDRQHCWITEMLFWSMKSLSMPALSHVKSAALTLTPAGGRILNL